LLIPESAESLKSPEATSLGTNQAQRAPSVWSLPDFVGDWVAAKALLEQP
jgi:hypothetical protein